jgi:hypothetical protein
MNRSKSSAAAASAAYRNALKKVAEVIDVEPTMTSYPKSDLDALLDTVPEAMRARILEWYQRGIKRGIAYATDRMADSTIRFDEDGAVIAPDVFNVRVGFRIDGKKDSRVFEIDAEKVGFSR